MSGCIIFQSALDVNSSPIQQLTNLELTGFVTINNLVNTDNGLLYGSVSYSTPTYTLNLYSDLNKTQLVATGTSTTSGTMNISSSNNSGISGTVNIVPGTFYNDSNLKIICHLSMDDDIPLDNLTILSEYDPTFGFASFHVQAFSYLKNFLQGKFESLLWNPKWINSDYTNGGTGGWDLSRCLSWFTYDIKEASSQYVLYLLARKNNVDPKGLMAQRAECAEKKVTAILESCEIVFDETYTRTPKKTRSASTFKISRA